MSSNQDETTPEQIQQWLDANPDPQSKGAVKFVKKLKQKLKNSQEEE
jgi:hypothetical protein